MNTLLRVYLRARARSFFFSSRFKFQINSSEYVLNRLHSFLIAFLDRRFYELLGNI